MSTLRPRPALIRTILITYLSFAQHTTPDPESFIFTEWNQPFAPADRRNAKEMLEDVDHEYHGPDTGMHHIRKTLLKTWSDVDEMTTKH